MSTGFQDRNLAKLLISQILQCPERRGIHVGRTEHRRNEAKERKDGVFALRISTEVSDFVASTAADGLRPCEENARMIAPL